MNNKKEIRNLIKSFSYAIRGVLFCIANERNMRIHMITAFYVILFSFFYDFSSGQYAIMFLAIVIVLVAEMINTAIEALVNLGAPAYNNFARIAKDVAAGAVLICAVFSACVGIVLFFRIEKIVSVYRFFLQYPLLILALLISLGFAFWFIFMPPQKFLVPKNKTYIDMTHMVTNDVNDVQEDEEY